MSKTIIENFIKKLEARVMRHTKVLFVSPFRIKSKQISSKLSEEIMLV